MRKHLTNEEIERYIDTEYVQGDFVSDEQLSVEELLKVEEHVLECDDCLKKVQRAIEFSHEYDAWMELKPTAQQKAVLESLKAVELQCDSQKGELKDRIRRWMNNWKKLSEYSLNVLFNTTYKGAANITRIARETVNPTSGGIQFEHPVQCYAMRGTATEFKKEIKNQIIGLVDNDSVVNINAEQATNSIRITFPAGRENGRVPLILLIPVEQGEQSKMLKPELNSETNQLEAVISNVNSGKYILAIEPLDLF
ncbi:MAG TPA: hypothetical protein PLB99_08480 [Thermotogota bacterium]|nr:hypothetical protein [Thermotogota bacterium]